MQHCIVFQGSHLQWSWKWNFKLCSQLWLEKTTEIVGYSTNVLLKNTLVIKAQLRCICIQVSGVNYKNIKITKLAEPLPFYVMPKAHSKLLIILLTLVKKEFYECGGENEEWMQSTGKQKEHCDLISESVMSDDWALGRADMKDTGWKTVFCKIFVCISGHMDLLMTWQITNWICFLCTSLKYYWWHRMMSESARINERASHSKYIGGERSFMISQSGSLVMLLNWKTERKCNLCRSQWTVRDFHKQCEH